MALGVTRFLGKVNINLKGAYDSNRLGLHGVKPRARIVASTG